VLFAGFSFFGASLLTGEGPLPARDAYLWVNLAVGVLGSTLIGAVAALISGTRRWAVWIGGVLCPFAGAIAGLAAFAFPQHGVVILSPAVVFLTFVQFLPTAVVGAVLAAYFLGRSTRTGPPRAARPGGAGGG
jgi:hypothetical protein